MQARTKKTVKDAIELLMVCFDTKIKITRYQHYEDALGHLDGDVLYRAAKTAVQHDRFFPLISRLKELYAEEMRQQRAREPIPKLGRSDPEFARQAIAEIRQRLRMGRQDD